MAAKAGGSPLGHWGGGGGGVVHQLAAAWQHGGRLRAGPGQDTSVSAHPGCARSAMLNYTTCRQRTRHVDSFKTPPQRLC